jgi:Tol biopolymer transport system component
LIYAGPALLQLNLVDRTGRPLAAVGEPGRYGRTETSPDGTKLTAMNFSNPVMIDLRRGLTSRITNASSFAVWSPDGRQLAIRRDGRIVIAAADGTGPEIAFPTNKNQTVSGWTPDGRALIYSEPGPDGRSGVWLAPLQSPTAARRLLNTTSNESQAAVSPDGTLVAYVSDATGRDEVYVQKMEGGSRTQLSSRGGKTPKWRRDGREVFYEALDGSLMSVPAERGPQEMRFAAPQTLFSLPATYISGYSYDTAPDGQRFVIIAPYRPHARQPLTVVVNWQALLTDKKRDRQ